MSGFSPAPNSAVPSTGTHHTQGLPDVDELDIPLNINDLDEASLNRLAEKYPPAKPPKPQDLPAQAARDVKSASINQFCGMQTLESRFGPYARKTIYTRLRKTADHGGGDDDVPSDSWGDAADYEEDADSDSEFFGGGTNDASYNPVFPIPMATAVPAQATAPVPGPTAWNMQSPNQNAFTQILQQVSMYLTDSHPTGFAHPLIPGPPFGEDTAPAPVPAIHGLSIPRVARARMNLTVLSQRYNLYFAVYQDQIHVYRPQPAPEILHCPELVLCPGPSIVARRVGGCIDRRFPHQVNHALVGDLGNQEILLLAYDDGDVIAYYTHHIRSFLERRERRRWAGRGPSFKKPKPFFRQTVGISAWGLAIHAQSRLIAVSSNLVEISVFAFALDQPLPPVDQRFHVFQHSQQAPLEASSSQPEMVETLHRRDRHWRILLPLGRTASNVPSITFVDNSRGYADKVVGVDIHGNAWFLNIWSLGVNHTPLLPPNGRGMGWGILPIPLSAFMKTNKMPTAPHRNRHDPAGSLVDISKIMTIAQTNDPLRNFDPVMRAYLRRRPNEYVHVCETLDADTSLWKSSSCADSTDSESGEPEAAQADGASRQKPSSSEDSDYDSEYDSDETDEHEDDAVVLPSDTYCPPWCASDDEADEAENGVCRLESVACPALSLAWTDLSTVGLVKTLHNAPTRRAQVSVVPIDGQKKLPDMLKMGERMSFLRTYTHDVELFTPGLQDASSVMFKQIMELPQGVTSMWDMKIRYHRLSLLHLIPEIGVAVVGASFGRVVLLRLLRRRRPPGPDEADQGKDVIWRSFRADWVLPRQEEEMRSMRPPCTLLGIAVSRVPEAGAGRWDLTAPTSQRQKQEQHRHRRDDERPEQGRRRWRLILHYTDHTILQYHIEEVASGTWPRRLAVYS